MITGKLVTLADGRQVDSGSEEWRTECQARAIMDLPTRAARLEYLEGRVDPATGRRSGGVLQFHGQRAVDKLKADILRLWELKKQSR